MACLWCNPLRLFARQSFWCIDTTLKSAGFFTYPYHVLVPSFGEWGYVLADLTGNYQPPQHYSLPMQVFRCRQHG